MSTEHNYAAFTAWAAEKLAQVRRFECLFCGYPTRHESRTCPAHRDLAPPLMEMMLDDDPRSDVESPSGARP